MSRSQDILLFMLIGAFPLILILAITAQILWTRHKRLKKQQRGFPLDTPHPPNP